MIAAAPLTVALVGNPNTGKTSLFNALAGMNQRVGNYPGVTVETKKGKYRHRDQAFDVIDLPGTYSLAARSPDEMIAVEVILGLKEHKADVVVAIVDASNLERNLYLATQLFDLDVPVVVALNMVDVAQGLGLEIGVGALERQLGVPVVPIQANKGLGLGGLRDAIADAADRHVAHAPVPFPSVFESEAARIREEVDCPPALARRALLDVGGQTERLLRETHPNGFGEHLTSARERLKAAGLAIVGLEPRTRYAWIRSAIAGCVKRPEKRRVTWTDRFDRVLTNRLWGSLVFLATMFVVFMSVFAWAKPLMELIGEGQTWLMDTVKGQLEPGPFRSLLVDGVIKGVGGVVVFLPQILILFAFIAVLEDCGYMARAAYLMDRIMSRAGLNGKSFIPLLSSVACAVPGILAARVVENRRDRFATILVAPLMSCSARLPVYSLLIGAFLTEGRAAWVPGLTLFGMYLIGIVVAPIVAFLLKRTALRGETPAFVMEMPLYKRPSLRIVARRAIEASWMFLRRAGTLILASMIVVWALLYFPSVGPDGQSYETQIAEREAKLDAIKKDLDDDAEAIERLSGPIEDELNAIYQEWKGQSYLGRLGKACEPAFRPLGWDWRIGMAVLASFPAREVIVGVLGIVFGEGDVDAGEESQVSRLGARLREVEDEQTAGRKLFDVPTALSIMVFFALCCQCVSTLAVIKRETASWGWTGFTFVYMTTLAYGAAWATYQIGLWCGGGA